jgi:hypothetical protein
MYKVKKIVCGIVYIPPIRTKYANQDHYLELQLEINKFDKEQILLFGDFISRTRSKSDIVECDELIFNLLGNDECISESRDIVNKLNNNEIPLQRKTLDKTVKLS